MTIEERAAQKYCQHKGIDPSAIRPDGCGWETNLNWQCARFEDLSLMLYFLKQAENTK